MSQAQSRRILEYPSRLRRLIIRILPLVVRLRELYITRDSTQVECIRAGRPVCGRFFQPSPLSIVQIAASSVSSTRQGSMSWARMRRTIWAS